jgi:hypothetical protein
VAGNNITIATDAENDSITFNATQSSVNTFSTIAVTGQTSVVADSSADTLTLAAGSGIQITTNAGSNTVTITNIAGGGGGGSTFSGLTDASTAGLTVDEIYLPAITKVVVTNLGASAYLFDQYSGNNPTLFAISGTTMAFQLSATGHPFLIQNPTGELYNTGLIHVATDGTVSTEGSAQGKDSGTLYWKIPFAISGGYRYQCSLHGSMVGLIQVKNISTI